MKRILSTLAIFCLSVACPVSYSLAAKTSKDTIPPLCYPVENTGAKAPRLRFPEFDKLPEVRELRSPLQWSNGKGEVKTIKEWTRRRNEIAQEIQHYEIGTKPTVDKNKQVKARMVKGTDGDTLFVDVTVGKETLTLSSVIHYPKVGKAPYPIVIGTSHISLPASIIRDRGVAYMEYNERQVNGYGQFRGDTTRTNYGFVHLYPELIDNGAYSEWAWGFSRLIDGLEILGSDATGIDTHRIAATGCSYAGKMALFCGAFDERVALTIAQEPGGGGAAAWRVSHTMEGVEDLDKTDYHWFKHSLREQFHGDSVYRLPYDHHELCAMICPRALLVLGNPDYKWLADESMRQSIDAAREAWERFGIGDRLGMSIIGGHPHCQLPESQYKIVGEYIDKYLIGNGYEDISLNPVINHIYTADPSARVFGDTLWLYPSHDKDDAVSFSMEDYHAFSTTDMRTWHDHGVIFTPAMQTSWAKEMAWAPDCIERNGKYYLYYPTDKRHIGVAVSDSPAGPFHDPLGHPLISIDTPGVICDRDFIDPCVFIDDDGQAYLFMGQNTACCIRLNDDMVSYDGTVHIIEGVKDFFEAVWVHKRNGLYYMSYSDGPFHGHEPQIAYCTSTSPLGPYEYRGVILDPVNSGTNHHSIVNYKGKDYLFYHTADLSRYNQPNFHCGVRRSVCVDPLYYNEDGTIRLVKQSINKERVLHNTVGKNTKSKTHRDK